MKKTSLTSTFTLIALALCVSASLHANALEKAPSPTVHKISVNVEATKPDAQVSKQDSLSNNPKTQGLQLAMPSLRARPG